MSFSVRPSRPTSSSPSAKGTTGVSPAVVASTRRRIRSTGRRARPTTVHVTTATTATSTGTAMASSAASTRAAWSN